MEVVKVSSDGQKGENERGHHGTHSIECYGG